MSTEHWRKHHHSATTLVEDKMRRFKGECAHFSFNKCPIYTHDSANAQFSTNSHETDNSAPQQWSRKQIKDSRTKSTDIEHWPTHSHYPPPPPPITNSLVKSEEKNL